MSSGWDDEERRRKSIDEQRKRDEAAATSRAEAKARLEKERAVQAEFQEVLRRRRESAAAQVRQEQAERDKTAQGFDRWAVPDWHLHGRSDGSWQVHSVSEDAVAARREQAKEEARRLHDEAQAKAVRAALAEECRAHVRAEEARLEEDRAKRAAAERQREADAAIGRSSQLRSANEARRQQDKRDLELRQIAQDRQKAEYAARWLTLKRERTEAAVRRRVDEEREAVDATRRQTEADWKRDEQDRLRARKEQDREEDERRREADVLKASDEVRRQRAEWLKAEDERRARADEQWKDLDAARQRELEHWKAVDEAARIAGVQEAREDWIRVDEARRMAAEQWRMAEDARHNLAQLRSEADAAKARRDAAWEEHDDTARLNEFYRSDLADAQEQERKRRETHGMGINAAEQASNRRTQIQRDRMKRDWLAERTRRGWPAIGNDKAAREAAEKLDLEAARVANASWDAEVEARRRSLSAWAAQRTAIRSALEMWGKDVVSAEMSIGEAMVGAFVHWMKDKSLQNYKKVGSGGGFWLPDPTGKSFNIGGANFQTRNDINCTTATYLAFTEALGRVFEGAAMLEPFLSAPVGGRPGTPLTLDVYWIWQRVYENVDVGLKDVPYLERKGAIDVLGALGVGTEIDRIEQVERFDILQSVVLADPKYGHSSLVFDVEKKDGQLVSLSLISANTPEGANPIRIKRYEGKDLKDLLRLHKFYIGRFTKMLQ